MGERRMHQSRIGSDPKVWAAEVAWSVSGSSNDSQTAIIDGFPCKTKYQGWRKYKYSIFCLSGFLSVGFTLYMYLCGLGMLTLAFSVLGTKGLGTMIESSPLMKDPMSAMVLGMMATVVLQSPGTTTNVLVAMVAADMVTVHDAIPAMIGSDLGSTVVSSLVSLTYSGDDEQFSRAFAAATLGDVFNTCVLFILLPLELMTGFIENLADLIVDPLIAEKGLGFKVLDIITTPIVNLVIQVNEEEVRNATIHDELFPPGHSFIRRCVFADQTRIYNCPYIHVFAWSHWCDATIGTIVLIFSVFILISCLIAIVFLIQKILEGPAGEYVKRGMAAECHGPCAWITDYVDMVVGMIITFIIQSNNVLNSSLTPMVGSGIISLEKMFPIILGANVGSTFGGVLAALSADENTFEKFRSLQMAVCQCIYAILATTCFYIPKRVRKIPLMIARKLGATTARSKRNPFVKYRWFIVVFLLTFFIILPLTILLISLLHPIFMIIFVSFGASLLILVILINIAQGSFPQFMPSALRDWKFLPIYFRSLKPYDPWMTKVISSLPVVGPFFVKTESVTKDPVLVVSKFVALTKQTPV